MQRIGELLTKTHRSDIADNVYYNVTISNTDISQAQMLRAQFEETRTRAIVERANEYYLSVVRFSIPGGALPIFVFRIQEDQALPKNVDLGIYSVTLEYAGDVQQVFLVWVPEDKTQPTPSANVQLQQRTPYYFDYTYQNMVNIMNTALATAFGNLAAPPVGSIAPWFEYNPQTQLISFVAQRAFYDISLATPINVYVNGFMFPFIQGLPVDFLGFNDPQGQDYQILVTDTFDNWYNPSNVAPVSPPDYYRLEQDYNSLNNWNDVRSVVFTTSLLPVNYEWIPASGGRELHDGEANFRPIITDFTPLLERAGDNRSTLQFSPKGPLRFIDLNTDQAIFRGDVQVWWLDDYNDLFPLMILPGQQVDVKFLFIKKELVKGKNFTAEDVARNLHALA